MQPSDTTTPERQERTKNWAPQCRSGPYSVVEKVPITGGESVTKRTQGHGHAGTAHYEPGPTGAVVVSSSRSVGFGDTDQQPVNYSHLHVTDCLQDHSTAQQVRPMHYIFGSTSKSSDASVWATDASVWAKSHSSRLPSPRAAPDQYHTARQGEVDLSPQERPDTPLLAILQAAASSLFRLEFHRFVPEPRPKFSDLLSAAGKGHLCALSIQLWRGRAWRLALNAYLDEVCATADSLTSSSHQAAARRLPTAGEPAVGPVNTAWMCRAEKPPT